MRAWAILGDRRRLRCVGHQHIVGQRPSRGVEFAVLEQHADHLASEQDEPEDADDRERDDGPE